MLTSKIHREYEEIKNEMMFREQFRQNYEKNVEEYGYELHMFPKTRPEREREFRKGYPMKKKQISNGSLKNSGWR